MVRFKRKNEKSSNVLRECHYRPFSAQNFLSSRPLSQFYPTSSLHFERVGVRSLKRKEICGTINTAHLFFSSRSFELRIPPVVFPKTIRNFIVLIGGSVASKSRNGSVRNIGKIYVVEYFLIVGKQNRILIESVP